jgi:hypothetical protein
MQVALAPLAGNKNIDAVAWYQWAMLTTGSMVGTGRYALPFDDKERTALLYQFFVLIAEDKVDLPLFRQNMYGASGYQDNDSSLYNLQSDQSRWQCFAGRLSPLSVMMEPLH